MAPSIKDDVIRIIAEQAVLQPQDVSLDQSLDDLGIDSLGLVESIFAIEEEFDCEIPEEEAANISTVQEVIDFVAKL